MENLQLQGDDHDDEAQAATALPHFPYFTVPQPPLAVAPAASATSDDHQHGPLEALEPPLCNHRPDGLVDGPQLATTASTTSVPMMLPAMTSLDWQSLLQTCLQVPPPVLEQEEEEQQQQQAAQADEYSGGNDHGDMQVAESSGAGAGTKEKQVISKGGAGRSSGKKKASRPRFAFQTRSDNDILDDGYRWRKYGQKAVKNSKHPRSYYRCTHHTCNVKKQVQRLAKDTSIVVTTYEGAPRPSPSLASALPFWFYLTAAVSLLALLLPHLLPSSSSSSPPPPLPPLLRSHASDGSVLKLHPGPDLFAVTSRPTSAAAHRPDVLILPGLAAGSFSFRHVLRSLSSRGLLAVAVDLPGQGMSPPAAPSAAPPSKNPFREIMDRGVFHAFEHLVETGEVPFQEPAATEPSHALLYAPHEAAASVARAVDALGLAAGAAPVHLVIHDSALVAGAAFVSANPAAVRSVTLIDTTAVLPAFPAAVLGVPVLGSMVVRVPALFKGLLRLCCARGMGAEVAEAHRAVMRMEGKKEAVFESWKALNQSFDLKEWRSSSEAVRKLPTMVLWSGSWTDRWIDEGKKVVAALPDAKFIYHSGGRWPQEDAYDELSELIAEFVTSLPTSVRSQHIDQSSEQATAQE